MAVTSIWPIKGRVDQVINYARNPEKTTEHGHGELAALHSIDGVVEYAAARKAMPLVIMRSLATAPRRIKNGAADWLLHT